MNEEKNESESTGQFRRLDIKSIDYDKRGAKVTVVMEDAHTVTFAGGKSEAEAVSMVLKDLWTLGVRVVEKKPETSGWEIPERVKLAGTSEIQVITDRISGLARRVCELENFNESKFCGRCDEKIIPESSKNSTPETIKHVFDGELA